MTSIPPEALEAGAKALCNEQRLFWPDLTKDEHDIIRGEARAAFLAIVEAWPGMHLGAPWVIGVPNATSIILPLPTEASDE